MKKCTKTKIKAVEAFYNAHKVQVTRNEITEQLKIFVDGENIKHKDIGARVFCWYEMNHGFNKKWSSMYHDLQNQLIFHAQYLNNQ
jgi:hypothetical protein